MDPGSEAGMTRSVWNFRRKTPFGFGKQVLRGAFGLLNQREFPRHFAEVALRARADMRDDLRGGHGAELQGAFGFHAAGDAEQKAGGEQIAGAGRVGYLLDADRPAR